MSNCRKAWPAKEFLLYDIYGFTIKLYLFAPETLTLYDAEKGLNNSRKDLWLHYAENQGWNHYTENYVVPGWWRTKWHKEVPSFTCYDEFSHKGIEEEMYFWIRNIYRIERGLPPITNPCWLQNKLGDILRLQLEHCIHSPDNDWQAHKLNVLISISSSNKYLLEDSEFLNRFIFFYEKGISKTALFLCREDGWKIITHLPDWNESLQNWGNKVLVPAGYIPVKDHLAKK